MDTCFPLLKLKHHCVRATGERNQPTERRERKERARESPLLAHWDKETDRRGERAPKDWLAPHWEGNSPWNEWSAESLLPQSNKLERRALSRFHFIPYFSLRAGHYFSEQMGRGKPSSQSCSRFKGVLYFSSNCLHFRSRVSEREREFLTKWQRAKQKCSGT